MISYSKEIKMKIHYKDKLNLKAKPFKELNLSSIFYCESKINNAMIIKIDDKEIVVDAYWLREACEKVIKLNEI